MGHYTMTFRNMKRTPKRSPRRGRPPKYREETMSGTMNKWRIRSVPKTQQEIGEEARAGAFRSEEQEAE